LGTIGGGGGVKLGFSKKGSSERASEKGCFKIKKRGTEKEPGRNTKKREGLATRSRETAGWGKFGSPKAKKGDLQQRKMLRILRRDSYSLAQVGFA